MVLVKVGVRGGEIQRKPEVHLWQLQPIVKFSLNSVTSQIRGALD